MIPISDSPKSRTVPWVTYTFILCNVAVFLYMFSLSTSVPSRRPAFDAAIRNQADSVCYGYLAAPDDLEQFVCRWAFQPKEFFDNLRSRSDVPAPDRPIILLSIFTAMFLHASWLHLAGNMLFLWVFGDNVEDRLGHARYALFYFTGGLIATITQALIDPSSVGPVLGASGAIASVLAAYLVFYPREKVRVVIPFLILIFIPFRLPALIVIGLWFLQNLVSGYFSLTSAVGPQDNTAWFAHIGGFLFGLLAARLLLSEKEPRA